MWITSETGFYSIVEHRDGPEFMLVRCRTKEDAEAFADFCGFLPAAVEEDVAADYRWRVKAKRADVEAFLSDQVRNITYTTSVKDAVDKGDPKRHAALLKVWTAMMALQDGGVYSMPANRGELVSGGEFVFDQNEAVPSTPEEIELIDQLSAIVHKLAEVRRPDDCFDLLYDQLDIICEGIEDA